MVSDIKREDIMLTVFLRHDQSQALEQFQSKLDERGWWDNFPPDGVEVIFWNVVMGIGQIVTLRLPPSKIQAVNVALEKYAWGVFRTETFVSYDFMAVRERLGGEARERNIVPDSPGAKAKKISSGAGGGDHPRLPHNGLYMEQWQAGDGNAGPYERALGDALEEIFGQGTHDLKGIADALNEKGLTSPDGETWTEDNFATHMKALSE
ncbi:MAG: recombinase-like helix-turn-helix domain-containing protein [Pseudomonadota bacterium]|nr:recombinase-like helix-turn-helix domain-containing protein [Pseudomonadota bacterium]